MSRLKPIQIIQGAQWGSEAKGAIAAYMCIEEGVDFAVRTGATNAGHTVVYNGLAVKMQQLPCGWVNSGTRLVLGAGALIDTAILNREIALVSELTGRDVRDRLYIDHRASFHDSSAAERSTASGRHHRIGATGKGCSEALMDKIKNRGTSAMTVEQRTRMFGQQVQGRVCDTSKMLNFELDRGAKIQLEGTQGTFLDLHLGPYPYVTHKQTGPAQWMMEAGLSPALETDIVLVARTFPIRVAGNSGPMPQEISWLQLAHNINAALESKDMPPLVSALALSAFTEALVKASKMYFIPAGGSALGLHHWTAEQRAEYAMAASEVHKTALGYLPHHTVGELCKLFEMTTVTRKLRRIAEFHHGMMAVSLQLNRPHRVVMTFMNYLFPHLWNSREPITTEERRWLDTIPGGDLVTHINRGPNHEHIIKVR